MFQDFKLNSEPEMSGRLGRAGLGPHLCGRSPASLPEVDF